MTTVLARNLMGIPDAYLQSFVSRVSPDPDTGCWNWTGYINPSGYGRTMMLKVSSSPLPTHRVAYRLAIGEIPDGFQLHHKCNNTRCCNPDHLVPASVREHTVELTPKSLAYIAAHTTHCPQGHPYDEKNTAYRKGKRYCLECNRQKCKARYRKSREGKPDLRLHDHCPAGHDLNDPAVVAFYTKNGQRYRRCRICSNEASKRSSKKRWAAFRAANPLPERTHCKKGHLYTPETTMWKKGSRSCRTCSREAERARYHAKKQQQQQPLAA